MSEILDRQMDRCVRGELSLAEARELAQAALADEALFDALAAHGAVEQSLESPEFRAAVAKPDKTVRFPRKPVRIVMAALAAAAAVAAIYIGARVPTQPKPTIASNAKPAAGQPILISKAFAPGRDATAPVFRSAPADARAPQPEGSIVAMDNFVVNIDLGSLDGLTKGTHLDVLRAGANQPVGHLEATTIFRDHSRVRIVSGAAKEHDRVRAEPSVYLSAVLDVMGTDRMLARNAVQWAFSNAVPPPVLRPILDRLAPLEYQARDFSAAERDYQLLLDAASTEDDRAEALNNLGAVAESRGETNTAQAFYQNARSAAANSTRNRQIIEANLARLAGGGREKH
jgi:hypothetical protein